MLPSTYFIPLLCIPYKCKSRSDGMMMVLVLLVMMTRARAATQHTVALTSAEQQHHLSTIAIAIRPMTTTDTTTSKHHRQRESGRPPGHRHRLCSSQTIAASRPRREGNLSRASHVGFLSTHCVATSDCRWRLRLRYELYDRHGNIPRSCIFVGCEVFQDFQLFAAFRSSTQLCRETPWAV